MSIEDEETRVLEAIKKGLSRIGKTADGKGYIAHFRIWFCKSWYRIKRDTGPVPIIKEIPSFKIFKHKQKQYLKRGSYNSYQSSFGT